MPNQNGCARRPEILAVRRREEAPAGGVTHAIVPVLTSTEPHEEPKPAVPHVVEEAKPVEVDCGGCYCATLRRRLCSGWTGVLFGLLLSGGLLVAIYFATSDLNATLHCTSIKTCGELFTDKYVCTTPQCDTSTPYTLSELQGIASSRAYRNVSVNLSWTGAGVDIEVNDHHDFECTKDDAGDRIYLAAEKAALACIQSKIDATNTSVEYIVGSELALLYADEWCAVDDAEPEYCFTARCTCAPTPLTLEELLEELANSSASTAPMLNATNATNATADNLVDARALGRVIGPDTFALTLFAASDRRVPSL